MFYPLKVKYFPDYRRGIIRNTFVDAQNVEIANRET
jgi:hypothetical protein